MQIWMQNGRLTGYAALWKKAYPARTVPTPIQYPDFFDPPTAFGTFWEKVAKHYYSASARTITRPADEI